MFHYLHRRINNYILQYPTLNRNSVQSYFTYDYSPDYELPKSHLTRTFNNYILQRLVEMQYSGENHIRRGKGEQFIMIESSSSPRIRFAASSEPVPSMRPDNKFGSSANLEFPASDGKRMSLKVRRGKIASRTGILESTSYCRVTTFSNGTLERNDNRYGLTSPSSRVTEIE